MIDILEFLKETSYPGRGIIVGNDQVYYFIMGRSENSRNRIFTETDDGIRTQAYDESKLEDPSLIIYHPVRRVGDVLIVTNGDQTDTIADFIRDGKSSKDALMTRKYEHDEPNWTPRISSVINADGSFEISILKHSEGTCIREFFEYESVEAGKGYFISTYQGDGSPLPTFKGEPVLVDYPEPEELWSALNKDNKVSLYVYNKGSVRLFNKHLGD